MHKILKNYLIKRNLDRSGLYCPLSFKWLRKREQFLSISDIIHKSSWTTMEEIDKNVNSLNNDIGIPVSLPVSVPVIEQLKTCKFFADQLESLSWLPSMGPGFALDGDKISVIHEPSKFYDVLLDKCLTSKKRITIASLYLGTGKLEEKLVSAIEQSLQKHGDNLKVKVLLDFTRGSRGKNNSRQMLLPLMNQHEQSCQVSLYHTPALRGLLRNVQRYNELVGLQHMKLYIFDDSLIISGANLSNDYFTNRQDRYVLIEDCKQLADFYDGLVSRVSEFSLQLDKHNNVSLHDGWVCHPVDGNRQEFDVEARRRVLNHLTEAHERTDVDRDGDTWVFPLVQMGQLGIRHDSDVTTRLLESALPDSDIHLATGYFNLTADYINSVVHRSRANYDILMAHPNANGFLNAKGPAGGIPFGYTLIASRFSALVESANQSGRVTLSEYQRPGWTYHAKGLWYTLPHESRPSLTLIGSPNFGGRSVCRDLETQVAVVTRNARLRQSLAAERRRLYDVGTGFTAQTARLAGRKPPLWVHCVVRMFRDVF